MPEFHESYVFEQKRNDVLAVGELLVDLISGDYDTAFGESSFQPYFGGSPANIAMNIKRLGGSSAIASAVGNDRPGQYLLRHLEAAGIASDLVAVTEESTSLVLLNKSRNSPIPVFYRNADFQLPYTEGLELALQDSKILHFSCWPISMLPARETIQRLVESAKRQNVLIGFDPNYHPAIWQKGEDGAAYVKRVIGHADIVKPSDDDAERLFGPDTPQNQLQKFLELGAKLVILTLGKEGAIASNGSETLFFPTMAQEVADTTGAGDAFWSGLYAALTQGYSIREAIMLGFAVTAYKLKYVGAVAELPPLGEIGGIYNL
ncbi:carbohydrate kinase family protein [Paenibacillus sp. CAU 1782]